MNPLSLLSLTPTVEAPKQSVLCMGKLLEICGEAGQAMSYGWEYCGFKFVMTSLQEHAKERTFPIQRVFDYTAGEPSWNARPSNTTLEGNRFNIIQFENDEFTTKRQAIGRMCKTGITNLILENYKRDQEDYPIIPLLFLIDCDDNEKPFKMEHMTSKTSQCNNQITYKELRRAYKLWNHSNPSIRKITQETIKFLKLIKVVDGVCDVEEISCPWDNVDFALLWQERLRLSAYAPKNPELDWNYQLEKAMTDFNVHMIEVGEKRKINKIKLELEEESAPPKAKRRRIEDPEKDEDMPPLEPIPVYKMHD